MVVCTLRLGMGGGVVAGLEAAVGRAASEAEEGVYRVSRDVVLTEEALEADPGIISTAFGQTLGCLHGELGENS